MELSEHADALGSVGLKSPWSLLGPILSDKECCFPQYQDFWPIAFKRGFEAIVDQMRAAKPEGMKPRVELFLNERLLTLEDRVFQCDS